MPSDKAEPLVQPPESAQVKSATSQPTPPSTTAAKTPMLDEWVMPYTETTTCNKQRCRLCPHEEDGFQALKRHIFAKHLNYKPYKCKYCAFTAVEPNTTEMHLLKEHADDPPRIVRLRYKGVVQEFALVTGLKHFIPLT